MALNPQIVPIVFATGTNTKIDPKQQLLGSLRTAKNVVFETVNSLRKRNGYDAITLRDSTTNAAIDIDRVSKYKNELLLLNNSNLYTYSQTLGKAVNKGPLYFVEPSSEYVLSSSSAHDQTDCLVVEGFTVFVYHNDSQDDVRYSVKDNATGALLVSNDVVGTSSQVIRVCSINNIVYLVYGSGTAIKYKFFDVFDPLNLSAEQTLANNLDTAFPCISAVGTSTKALVAYNSTAGGAAVRVASINSDGSAGTGIGITGSAQAPAVNLLVDSVSRVVVSWADATDVYYCIINFPLTFFLVSPTLIEAVAGVTNITAVETSAGIFSVHYEVSAASRINYYIKQNTFTVAGTVSTPSVFIRSLGLAGTSFLIDGAVYVVAAYESQLQSTYFILDSNATVLCKFAAEVGGGHSRLGVVPKTQFIESTKVVVANLKKNKIVADNGTFFGLAGANSTTLDFTPAHKYSNEMLGPNLHIAGGVLQMYDGDEVVEHGFHIYPESVTAGSTTTTGGNISNGNYSYLAVYRWTDAAGQDHYSTPSAALEVVLSGGTSTQTQQIVVPNLRVTSKHNVVIELYRTENNGSVYYLASSPLSPTFSSTSSNTTTITDTVSDTVLIGRQPLYTTGGLLDNSAAPSASVVSVHTASNRLMLLGLEDSHTIQYSKIRQDGAPVEFNEALRKSIDPVGGALTAGISMDEKFIIFAEDAIFYIAGQGPNNLGQQDDFTEPERIASDVGCIEPRSVVFTPIGVMFKSRKGIFLLDRGLGLKYVGAPVEAYNNLTITSAKVVGSVNQIRFTTQDGDCLVFNYQLGLWGTFDNHRANSAETVGDDYYYVRTDNTLFKENRTNFSDNGSSIGISIETGWMSFNQLQGFQRVYKMLVLGSYKSPHQLRIQVAYDFNDAWVEEKIITPTADFVSDSRYGDDSPYGSGSPYGGDGNVYQARFDFAKQKCQSIKLRISDVQSVPGEGLSLSAFTLQIGGKKGLFKPGQNRIYGVE